MQELITIVKEFDRIDTILQRMDDECGGQIEQLSETRQLKYRSLDEKREELRAEISFEQEALKQRAMYDKLHTDAFTEFSKQHPQLAKMAVWFTTILMIITNFKMDEVQKTHRT